MKTKIWISLTLLTGAACTLHAAPAAEGYVAHEWGTFTSVQGAQGVQMEWNPFLQWDLPEFVYDRNQNNPKKAGQRVAELALKNSLGGRQRMETPVIYFYSDIEQTVDVEVQFPQGLMTEWYPAATSFGPFNTTNAAEKARSLENYLQWNQVRILHPEAQSIAPQPGIPPSDQTDNHYYAARETSANLLEIAGPRNAPGMEHEKFLFYRGLGHFEAPLLTTTTADSKSLRIENRGTDALTGLTIVRIQNGHGFFLTSASLQPGAHQTFKLETPTLPVGDLRRAVRDDMQDHLVGAGLYPDEALAMVNTWNDSWFGEEGLRVLYLLPQTWTDQMLPITLNPKPEQLVRVMVGRAEVITPTMEWELLKQVVRFSDTDEAGRTAAVEAVRALKLGRFAEPTARRILGETPAPSFHGAAWTLLQKAQLPLPVTPDLALK